MTKTLLEEIEQEQDRSNRLATELLDRAAKQAVTANRPTGPHPGWDRLIEAVQNVPDEVFLGETLDEEAERWDGLG